jgi:hypothetical protein
MENEVLKLHGRRLKDLKTEEFYEEKTKNAALRGIFHGFIIIGYHGASF